MAVPLPFVHHFVNVAAEVRKFIQNQLKCLFFELQYVAITAGLVGIGTISFENNISLAKYSAFKEEFLLYLALYASGNQKENLARFISLLGEHRTILNGHGLKFIKVISVEAHLAVF